MIIRTEMDGRSCTLQYLTMDREPTTEDKAEMVYIIFDDDGTTMWAYPADDEEDDDEPED